ncbi:MAG: ribbon-helix-helix protein, CopG family [Desulfobacterales bacterium]|nr:MAG: ribbon-helix-helix protein, CopG family [Desulfobacterales bacterium]
MATTQTEKLVRKQFLISPGQVEKLDRLARSEGTSVAEIVRIAIDNFDPNMAAINDLDSQQLMELVAARLKEAIASTRKANRKVDKALKILSKRSI